MTCLKTPTHFHSLEATVHEVTVKDVLVRLRRKAVVVQQIDQVRQLPVKVADLFYFVLYFNRG